MRRAINKENTFKYAVIVLVAVLAMSISIVSVCQVGGITYADTAVEVYTTYNQLVYSKTANIGDQQKLNVGSWIDAADIVVDKSEYILSFHNNADTSSDNLSAGTLEGICIYSQEDENLFEVYFGNQFDSLGEFKTFFELGDYDPSAGHEYVEKVTARSMGDTLFLTLTDDELFFSRFSNWDNDWIEGGASEYEYSLNHIICRFDKESNLYNRFVSMLLSQNPIVSYLTDYTGKMDYTVTETLNAYKEIEVPQKEGHVFKGWYYDAEFTRPYKGEAIDADTNLYAKYEKLKYKVTYDASNFDTYLDAEDSNAPFGWFNSSQVVEYGDILALPTIDFKDTGVDYLKFVGWYYDAKFTRPYNNEEIKSDVTLYGQFMKNKCVVTFDLNGREGSIEPIEVEYGTKIELTYPTDGDYRVQYWDFPAWNPDLPVVMDMNLVAVWEKYILKVTFYIDNEVWKEVQVEKGQTLGNVAFDVNVDSKSVVGYENMNSVTVASSFAEFVIEDDVAVYLSEVSNVDDSIGSGSSLNAWQNFWNNVKAFFERIGLWFKSLFSLFKK